MPTEGSLAVQQFHDPGEQLMPSKPAPAYETADGQAVAPSPGRMLRDAREAAGLSLPEVADAMYMTVHYVKALERDDYAKLPGLTFVKGYCKAYARYLNLDVDSVLAAYELHLREHQDLVMAQRHDFRIRRRRNDQAVLWAVAAGILLVLALFTAWWIVGRDAGQQTAALPVPASDLVTQVQS